MLALARSEIGANRQNRGNRFLTVIQYSLDMALALREMARAAKPGARLILVVGRESSVRGVRFFNGELVAELAVRCVGMQMERRQERRFRNRYGTHIYEDILHFLAPAQVPDESLFLDSGAKYRTPGTSGYPSTRSSQGTSRDWRRVGAARIDFAVSNALTCGPLAGPPMTMRVPDTPWRQTSGASRERQAAERRPPPGSHGNREV